MGMFCENRNGQHNELNMTLSIRKKRMTRAADTKTASIRYYIRYCHPGFPASEDEFKQIMEDIKNVKIRQK